MKVEFKASFARDLKRIKERAVLTRVQEVIKQIEIATNTPAIKNLKRLRGEGKYYRVRLGDYRLGLTVDNDRVSFVRILHRKEIYRYFP